MRLRPTVESPPRRSRVWSAAPTVLTCIYWLTLLVWGLYRLRRDGTEAAYSILSVWYVAGLLFLGVWGLFAAIVGIVAGGRREKGPRRQFDAGPHILSVRKR